MSFDQFMFHHFSSASCLQVENPNVLKHVINKNT